MCNGSAKLIAWLDLELPESEAAEVRGHVEDCEECRGQVEQYARVSREFDAYCEAAMTPAAQGHAQKWKRILLVAAAAAAAIALLVNVPRAHIQKAPAALLVSPASKQENNSETAPALVKSFSATVKRTHARHSAAPLELQPAAWQPAERTVEIAIPADSIYPPGAVPEGMSFVVDMRINADGSAQQISLWP